MYVGNEFAVTDQLPDVLMADDDEQEIIVKNQIIKPILDNLVTNIEKEMQIKHLQKYVELNMEIVEKETTELRKETIIEDILSECIRFVVSSVESNRCKYYLFLQTTKLN